jgi:hypothetical protein
MGIAFNAAADGGNNGGTTNSLTFSYTCGSGSNRLLIVGVVGDQSVDDVTGVTYNSVSMTLAVKETTVYVNNRVTYLYYLLNPTSGANNVVISCTGVHLLIAGAADYTGVAQSDQPDAALATIGPNTNIVTLTSSLTTIADKSWVILFEQGYNTGPPPTAGSGLTQRAFDGVFGAWGIFDSAADVTPAGAYSMTTNRSSSSDSIIHAKTSFSPVGAVTIVSSPYSKLILLKMDDQ